MTRRDAKAWLRLARVYLAVGLILFAGPPSWWPRWLPWPIPARMPEPHRVAATTEA